MRALILDTETTNLVTNHSMKLDQQPSIVEFCGWVVDLSTGEIEDELDLLIKPPSGVTEETTKITGLTDEMLKDAPEFASVAHDIRTFIEGREVVIAHNASFDCEMLDLELERRGKKIAWPRVICTVEATIHLKGFRLKLADLYKMLFNEEFAGAHRARVDVQALTRCCVELFRRGEI
jgi:DNA polymerase III epsilon subunit family exonuclease